MKVAVIGAGLFGCTAAIHAARAGHEVHLFEQKPILMGGATASSFQRLHRGAHYPRHSPTGAECRRAEASFRSEYGAAVIDGGRQMYVVADVGSHVSVDEFRAFLDDEGLRFSEEEGVFHVSEPRINLAGLATLVRHKVKDAGVKVHLGQGMPADARRHFDKIVVATYSRLNETLWNLGCTPMELKFQVVEKPVVLLPPSFRDTSIVVIDGPFGCLDPLDETPLHVLGHVTEANHWSFTGYRAEIPEHLDMVIDKGLLRNPPVSNFAAIMDGLAKFVPEVRKAVYAGSMFTTRAVLAHVEASDKRPTLVTRHDGQVQSVLSGKLGTACAAAKALCESFAEHVHEAA